MCHVLHSCADVITASIHGMCTIQYYKSIFKLYGSKKFYSVSFWLPTGFPQISSLSLKDFLKKKKYYFFNMGLNIFFCFF